MWHHFIYLFYLADLEHPKWRQAASDQLKEHPVQILRVQSVRTVLPVLERDRKEVSDLC